MRGGAFDFIEQRLQMRREDTYEGVRRRTPTRGAPRPSPRASDPAPGPGSRTGVHPCRRSSDRGSRPTGRRPRRCRACPCRRSRARERAVRRAQDAVALPVPPPWHAACLRVVNERSIFEPLFTDYIGSQVRRFAGCRSAACRRSAVRPYKGLEPLRPRAARRAPCGPPCGRTCRPPLRPNPRTCHDVNGRFYVYTGLPTWRWFDRDLCSGAGRDGAPGAAGPRGCALERRSVASSSRNGLQSAALRAGALAARRHGLHDGRAVAPTAPAHRTSCATTRPPARAACWSPARALVPAGATKALDIDDYAWSADGKRLLIFTNTQKVWRDNTRGDYWVLDSRPATSEASSAATRPSRR